MDVEDSDTYSHIDGLCLSGGSYQNSTLTSESYALLSQCIQGKKPDDFVLTRPNGKPVRDFRSQWTTACNRAGCPDLLFHDLRRTAARNMRAAGIAEGVIMKIGGWRTRSVFERYAIVTESDMADAMQKLEMREKQLDQHNGHVFGHVGQSESKVAQPVVLS